MSSQAQFDSATSNNFKYKTVTLVDHSLITNNELLTNKDLIR